jgi:hypothetical protein
LRAKAKAARAASDKIEAGLDQPDEPAPGLPAPKPAAGKPGGLSRDAAAKKFGF